MPSTPFTAASTPAEQAFIASRLAADGLLLRGGFHPGPGDQVPALPDGQIAGTLLMVGNAGPAMWRAFRAAPEAADGEPDPLDRWVRRCLDRIAAPIGAIPLFPFDGPPYLPFQRWAMRAEPVHPSPIGLLIHPEFGLWHAYRGALALAAHLPLPPRDLQESPCTRCPERPCLTTCPVGAFTPGDYAVAACIDHLSSLAGADCMALSCRARRACPIGQAYLLESEQASFHMQAYRRSAAAN